MKAIVYTLLFGSLLISCDDREKFIDTLNTAPVLVQGDLNNGLVLVKDSIKLSLKNSQKFYPIVLNLADANKNIVSTKYEWQTGSGTISQDGNPLNTGSLNPPGLDGKLNLQVYPSAAGLSRILFRATDKFNAEAIFTLELTGFINLNPVANLVLTPNPQNDPLQYTFNASSSYDRDKKYGGAVARYIYTVANQPPIETNLSSIQYIFDQKKNYVVTLQVQDNDGTLSTVFSQTYNIH